MPLNRALRALSAAIITLAACNPKESGGTNAPAVAQYSIDDFYGNTRYFGASFSPDGQSLLTSSDQSGIFNAYAMPLAGGAPKALTSSTVNSVFAQGYFPKDERILFQSDSGGNELTHIYVRNTDGTTRDLTPGSKLKASFIGWANDDKSFFFISNERDPKHFDLYEVAADGYARTQLYKNTQGLDVAAISRDKRWMALSKPNTTSDADIVLLDRQKGTTKLITPHTGDVSNQAFDFSPDNTRLLFLSDSGREFTALRSYDLASGATAQVLAPDWDIAGGAYSRGGKYLVVLVDEDATQRVHVYDAKTMAPVALAGIPSGSIASFHFAPNDSAYAFEATDGSAPLDIYVGSLTSAPRRLTNALNPKIARQDLVVPKVMRFKSYDSLEVPGLLYMPHQASNTNKVPAMVMVHGGPGGQATVGYRALTQFLANHGYVVYDINNRGSSGYGKTFNQMDDRKHGEADLGDVVASKGMLIGTGDVDTAKIGIIGGSYGGYMVLAALTLRPDAFKVGVDMFGVANWPRTLSSVPPWWESFKKALYAEMGDPVADSARLRRISPLFNTDKIRVPLMVLQGANDPRVLQVESDEIVAAAKKNGVPVTYIVFPDEGHGFVKKENEKKGYGAVMVFLDTYLKGVKVASSQ